MLTTFSCVSDILFIYQTKVYLHFYKSVFVIFFIDVLPSELENTFTLKHSTAQFLGLSCDYTSTLYRLD